MPLRQGSTHETADAVDGHTDRTADADDRNTDEIDASGCINGVAETQGGHINEWLHQ